MTRYCLWGHRAGYVQIGGPMDRVIQQRRAREAEALQRLATWSPRVRQLTRAITAQGATMAEIGRAIERLSSGMRRGRRRDTHGWDWPTPVPGVTGRQVCIVLRRANRQLERAARPWRPGDERFWSSAAGSRFVARR